MLDWGSLSVAKTEAAIDYWVDRYDPYALRRVRAQLAGPPCRCRRRRGWQRGGLHRGQLFAQDAAALDQRLEAMARAVCEADPRTLEQRRADALGALAHGADRLACAAGDPDCEAAGRQPAAVVLNVIAEEDSAGR